MNSVVRNRLLLILSICVTAIVAAGLAIWYFDLTTPPRDINFIINSAALPAPPTPVPPPTPTVIPPTPALVLNDNFKQTANFPPGPSAHYTAPGYTLKPDAKSDYLAAPLAGFQDTSYHNVTLLTTAVPISRSVPIEYGVFFWHSTASNKGERFLAFTLSPSGTYRLRAYIPFTSSTSEGIRYRAEDLVPATRSLYVKTDGSPNQLRVDVHPHHILAFVNGGLVLDRNNSDIDAYRDRADFDGQVGLLAFASGDQGGQVEFTQFAMYADVKR